MWMLMMLLQSPLVPDALKPVQTYYQSQEECQSAYKKETEKGRYNGACYLVTWK